MSEPKVKKPSLFRTVVIKIVAACRRVMDVKYNPLKNINEPSLQAYFMLVLFTIWSVFFGFIATYYLGWYGYNTVTSIEVHLTVLIPIIFTNAVFKDAERNGDKWFLAFKDKQKKK